MADSDYSALSNIRIKVRRLTKSPSTNQLSNGDIDKYINTYILYDMPACIKPTSFKKVFTFYTTKDQDTYSTSEQATDDLYNFKNKVVNVVGPAYVAGNNVPLYSVYNDFFSHYSLNQYKIKIATGDGVTTNFTGTLKNRPILKNYAMATSTDINSQRLLAVDDGSGQWQGDVGVPGSIDYITGQYDITFSTAPMAQEDIYIQHVPYKAGKPCAILFFNNKFILRPVPDISYRVDINAYQRPTELDNSDDMPELSEWWELISYGAAIKVLQDRLDDETVNILSSEFARQEVLAMRRKIMQNSNTRAETIFSDSLGE